MLSLLECLKNSEQSEEKKWPLYILLFIENRIIRNYILARCPGIIHHTEVKFFKLLSTKAPSLRVNQAQISLVSMIIWELRLHIGEQLQPVLGEYEIKCRLVTYGLEIFFIGLCHKDLGRVEIYSFRAKRGRKNPALHFFKKLRMIILSAFFSPEKSFISSACGRFRFWTKVGFRFRFRFWQKDGFRFRFWFCAHA